MSSVVPRRCIGTVCIISRSSSGPRSGIRGVIMAPGATALMRTPRPAHSTDMLFTRLMSPAFAAPYDAWYGELRIPSMEATHTSEPGSPRPMIAAATSTRGHEEVAEVAPMIEIPVLERHVEERRPARPCPRW